MLSLFMYMQSVKKEEERRQSEKERENFFEFIAGNADEILEISNTHREDV